MRYKIPRIVSLSIFILALLASVLKAVTLGVTADGLRVIHCSVGETGFDPRSAEVIRHTAESGLRMYDLTFALLWLFLLALASWTVVVYYWARQPNASQCCELNSTSSD
jgi:hypothetical protein